MNSDNTKKLEKYSHWWNDIVNTNFNTEAIIFALHNVGDENENEFIDYMKRKFIRRTIDEWMGIYERDIKINQYNDLKISGLSTDMESENFLKIKEYKFVETEKGKITLQNLKNFEMRYILEISQAQAIRTGIESVNNQKNKKEQSHKETENKTIFIQEDVKVNSLKNFKRGELQRELKKYIKEYNLIKDVTVKSNKISLITRKLKGEGWDAKEQSVAVTLRKMGYVEEWKT